MLIFIELIGVILFGIYIYRKTFYKKQAENRSLGYSAYTSDRLASNVAFCRAFIICLLLIIFCVG